MYIWIYLGVATHCDGHISCMNTEMARQRRFVCCGGGAGCFASKIRGVKEVRAYGTWTMRYAEIIGAETVKGYGYGSLADVTIDSGPNTITVQAFAEKAGENANLICRDGATCTLSCKGTGCNLMNYRCLGEATCNIAPVGCLPDNSVNQVNGVACPTFRTSLAEDTMDVNVDEDMNSEK